MDNQLLPNQCFAARESPCSIRYLLMFSGQCSVLLETSCVHGGTTRLQISGDLQMNLQSIIRLNYEEAISKNITVRNNSKLQFWFGYSKTSEQCKCILWLTFENVKKSDNGMIFRNSIVLCAINNIFKPTYSKKKQLQYQYTISQLIHNFKNVDS